MPRPKRDSIQTSMSFSRDIYEMIQREANRAGVSNSAYVSMVLAQKNLEMNAMRLIQNVPEEKIRELLNQNK
jgi:hypothetical protein